MRSYEYNTVHLSKDRFPPRQLRQRSGDWIAIDENLKSEFSRYRQL